MMSEGVVAVERELENQQQICETLRSELQELDQEAAQGQHNKTQVCAIHAHVHAYVQYMEIHMYMCIAH